MAWQAVLVYGLREYAIASRGGSWPTGECLILDPARSEPIAVVRDEPRPEVLDRPWPDGARGRPWLMRLFGVERHPRQIRTIVRRYHDGRPLTRLHQRQPLFQKTVGIFDDEDRRVGYGRWPFMGAGPRDRFDLVWVDHQKFAEVASAEADVYRVAETQDGRELAAVTISRGGIRAGAAAECRVSLSDAAFGREKDGVFLMAAALVLFLPD